MSRRNSDSSTSLSALSRKKRNLDSLNNSIEGDNSSVEGDNKSVEGDRCNTIEGDEESVSGERHIVRVSSVKGSKIVPINDASIV